MIKRYKGTLNQILSIDNFIIKNTTCNDKSKSQNNPSKAFVKQYDIYFHTEGSAEIQLLFALIPSVSIKLIYDYRNLTGEIKIDTEELNILKSEIPELRKIIKQLNETKANSKMSKLQNRTRDARNYQYI